MTKRVRTRRGEKIIIKIKAASRKAQGRKPPQSTAARGGASPGSNTIPVIQSKSPYRPRRNQKGDVRIFDLGWRKNLETNEFEEFRWQWQAPFVQVGADLFPLYSYPSQTVLNGFADALLSIPQGQIFSNFFKEIKFGAETDKLLIDLIWYQTSALEAQRKYYALARPASRPYVFRAPELPPETLVDTPEWTANGFKPNRSGYPNLALLDSHFYQPFSTTGFGNVGLHRVTREPNPLADQVTLSLDTGKTDIYLVPRLAADNPTEETGQILAGSYSLTTLQKADLILSPISSALSRFIDYRVNVPDLQVSNPMFFLDNALAECRTAVGAEWRRKTARLQNVRRFNPNLNTFHPAPNLSSWTAFNDAVRRSKRQISWRANIDFEFVPDPLPVSLAAVIDKNGVRYYLWNDSATSPYFDIPLLYAYNPDLYNPLDGTFGEMWD